MQLILDQSEKLKVVYDCLCTGLPYFMNYGFTLAYNPDEYVKARQNLIQSGHAVNDICIEDVQIEMLKMGFTLNFVDHESGGEYTTALTLARIEKEWGKIPSQLVQEMVQENGDADTADSVMQYILFGEIVFG